MILLRYKLLMLCLLCIAVFNINLLGYAESHREKVENELKSRQVKLQDKKNQINNWEKEISIYDEQIEKHTEELEQSQKKLELQKIYLQKIMVRVYMKGDLDFLASLMSSSSIKQFLLRLQIIRIFLKEEQAILTQYMNAKLQVEAHIRAIERSREQRSPLLKKAGGEVAEIEKQLKDLYDQLRKIDIADGIIFGGGPYSSGRFQFPSPGGRLVSNYGEWRGSHRHQGIDIPNHVGAPICAVNDGVVVKMKANPGGYGYYIDISHADGLVSRYAHMYRSTVRVSLGQSVRKGERIAAVGLNGHTDGAHVHLEILRDGVAINPIPFFS